MECLPLKLDEQQSLREFRVCFQKGEGDSLTIPIRELTNNVLLKNYMDRVQQKLNAPNLMVAASMFAKRYSYLIVVPALYSFSALNKRVNVSIDHVSLEPSGSKEYWLPELYLMDQTVVSPSTIKEREELREQVITELFADHLNVIWEELSKIGKIPKQTLWENTAIYLFWLYETLLDKDFPELTRKRIKDDFHYLLYNADSSLFGNYNRNPITKFFHDKQMMDGSMVRKRRTCCFSYESETRKMCKTCPKNSC
ncbi:siderophore-iron reductase FhuF [Halalkalibacter kiskunsagensis]|uniref:Siderophore-iron reductase FhuF n=1 Tax=Halalkalibacter kiskunsagensis TaxID=1548599 RepID=A0ABV6KAN7_9BACI